MKKKVGYIVVVIIAPLIVLPILYYSVYLVAYLFSLIGLEGIHMLTISFNSEIKSSTYLTLCVYILGIEIAGILSYQLYKIAEIDILTRKRKLHVQFHFAVTKIMSELYENHEIYRPNGNIYDEQCVKDFMSNPLKKFKFDAWKENRQVFYEYEGKLGLEINKIYEKLNKLERFKKCGEEHFDIESMSGFGNELFDMSTRLFNINSFDEVYNINIKSQFHDV